MFPLRDENPSIRTSFATFFIIGLNIISWAFLQGFGVRDRLVESVCSFGLISGKLFGSLVHKTIIPLSNNFVCRIDKNFGWITVITSMFMHGSWFHIIINMWFLFVFGDNVEDALGHLRFILFYLFCGICAVFTQIMFNPSSVIPMVGASGAISGIMGAYAILYPRAPIHVLMFLFFYFERIVLPAGFMLFYWFFLQLIGGIFSIGGEVSSVAFMAHVGGFIAGIATIKIFCKEERLLACRKKRTKVRRIMERYRTFRDIIDDF
ncbi:MAG: rhomboid family intramembrane serine protease [Candidatus Omnitrophica bacterium]|nr:rhomboid family intramembrane serine protease [Candidatus Omnitrophota bacterium]